MLFAVTDALSDEGGGIYDLAPPEMFFVSENQSASALSGTFTTTSQNYAVNSATGTVTFANIGGGASDLLGAIGPAAESFILTNTALDAGAAPNDDRFLGLGLRQGS
jgi:hypothetical protein